MLKFTVAKTSDPDLAGVPTAITGVNKETSELILRFEEGSGLFVRVQDLVLVESPCPGTPEETDQ